MKLKELVLSNPDLPVIVAVMNYDEGEPWHFYEDPDAVIGKVFKHEKIHDFWGNPFTDQDDVKNALFQEFGNDDMTEEEFTEKILPQYESYWQKCILVRL